MLLKMMAADWLKIRRSSVPFLAVLGPLGVIGMQAANYGLRYDYLVNLTRDDVWGAFLNGIAKLALPALLIGLALVASITAGLEHQTNAWKQLLALPVRRGHVFLGKWLLAALLLLFSSTLLAAGALVLGAALGFDLAEAPYVRLLEIAYFPYLAVMPFLALHVWLSITMANQAVPLTIGIAGTVVTMFAFRLADWMPYKWAIMAGEADDPHVPALYGIALGASLLAAGAAHFIRKDVR